MKHYEALVNMGSFTRHDLIRLTGSDAAAHSLVYSYLKRGLIQRVRRDLYAAVSLETKQPVPNRFAIGSHVSSDACISHHSAFAYYGYANQVFYDIYVASSSRFRDFEFGGYRYNYVRNDLASGIASHSNGVRVTDMERTVVDSINDFEKIGGLEELLRCLELIPHLNADRLLSYLEERGIGFLWQKTGYILEHFREALILPERFFEECLRNLPGGKRYLYKGFPAGRTVFNSVWQMYVPAELALITSQGVDDDAYL